MPLEYEDISLSSSSTRREDGDSDHSILIANTNKLLSAVGIGAKRIVSIEELCRVAPSMFVAIFEALYQMRIDEVIRQPKFHVDYVRNAQLVIDQLSDQIGIDLVHIDGASIVDGDLDALNNLIHIFMRIVSLASERSISTIESDSATERSQFSETSVENASMAADLESNMLNKRWKTIAQASKRAHSIQMLESQQRLAGERRKASMQRQIALARVRNQKKSEISDKIKSQRFWNEQQTMRRSFEIKVLHQEEQLLSELFKNIFIEAKRSRADLRKETVAAAKALNEQTELKVQQLEKIYQNKLSMMKEELNTSNFVDLSSYRDLISNIKTLYEAQILKQMQRNDQTRDRHILQRREAILSVFPTMATTTPTKTQVDRKKLTSPLRSTKAMRKQII